MNRLIKLAIAGIGAAGAIVSAAFAVRASLPDHREQARAKQSQSYQAYLATRRTEAKNIDAATAGVEAQRSSAFFDDEAPPELRRASAWLRALAEPSLRPGSGGPPASLRLLWLPAQGEAVCLRITLLPADAATYLVARAAEPPPPGGREAKVARRRVGNLSPRKRDDVERRLGAAALDRLASTANPPASPEGMLIAETNVGGRYACIRRPAPPEPALIDLFDLLSELGGVSSSTIRSGRPAEIPRR